MASLPLFFHGDLLTANTEVWLQEDTAKHIGQVLRMKEGEGLQLTDGKGNLADAVIVIADKKKCKVSVGSVLYHELPAPALHLAVAFTKNTSRNEWLLEKATELGVRSIIPLATARTERERIKHERWHNILVSALMQSQQFHLPALHELSTVEDVLNTFSNTEQKFIAHCINDKQRRPIAELIQKGKDALIFIGPEGDFTADEVALCEANDCKAVLLAGQRLRTETAAMSVCAYFNTINTNEE